MGETVLKANQLYILPVMVHFRGIATDMKRMTWEILKTIQTRMTEFGQK